MTIDPEEAGSVTVSPDQDSYDVGATVVITALPATGYSFGEWTGDDKLVGLCKGGRYGLGGIHLDRQRIRRCTVRIHIA